MRCRNCGSAHCGAGLSPAAQRDRDTGRAGLASAISYAQALATGPKAPHAQTLIRCSLGGSVSVSLHSRSPSLLHKSLCTNRRTLRRPDRSLHSQRPPLNLHSSVPSSSASSRQHTSTPPASPEGCHDFRRAYHPTQRAKKSLPSAGSHAAVWRGLATVWRAPPWREAPPLTVLVDIVVGGDTSSDAIPRLAVGEDRVWHARLELGCRHCEG